MKFYKLLNKKARKKPPLNVKPTWALPFKEAKSD